MESARILCRARCRTQRFISWQLDHEVRQRANHAALRFRLGGSASKPVLATSGASHKRAFEVVARIPVAWIIAQQIAIVCLASSISGSDRGMLLGTALQSLRACADCRGCTAQPA